MFIPPLPPPPKKRKNNKGNALVLVRNLIRTQCFGHHSLSVTVQVHLPNCSLLLSLISFFCFCFFVLFCVCVLLLLL